MKAALVLVCMALVLGAQGCAKKVQPAGSSQPQSGLAGDFKGQPPGSSQWKVSIADDFKDGISITVFDLDGKYIKAPAGSEPLTPRLHMSCSGKQLGGANIELGMAIPHEKSPAGSSSPNLKSTPRIRIEMQWGDKKTPDEDRGEVMNEGQSIYLDRSQTRKLLTGYSLGPPDQPFSYVHRQSISVVDALGNRIVMLFEFPEDDAGIKSDCGLETPIQSHGPPPVYRPTGDYYAKRGEYEKAIAWYDESLKLDPSNTHMRQKLDETIKACTQENTLLLEHLKCGTH